MTTHLSVRICWHDSGWNGRICKNPKNNKFCTFLDHIREKKDEKFEDIEVQYSGIKLSEPDLDKIDIPCGGEIAVYSEKGYDINFVHPLKLKHIPGYDLDPCIENLKPYSFYPAPYKWLMVESYNKFRRKENLELRDLTTDDRYYSNNKGPKKKKTWIDDAKLQEKLLKCFWDKLEDNKSLVLFYVNSSPAAEDMKRVIVGIGRIKGKSKMALFGNSKERPGPNYVWQRGITQNYPEEGFRLPYQEYIEQGLDPENILLTAPEDFDNQFKYVSEHVSDGAMLAVVEQFSKIIDRIQTDVAEGNVKLNEDWDKHKKWIQKIIEELWKNRGQYPGIGSVLQFLGFNRGMTYHQEILIPLEKENENTFQHIIDILDGKKLPEKQYEKDFDNSKRKWNAYSSDPDRRNLIELLMRLEVSEDQVERLVKEDERYESGIKFDTKQIVYNPYLISESDKGQVNNKGEILSERIPLDVIDHAMVPSFNFPDKYSPDDDRRVRAVMIEELVKSAKEGDTLLDIKDLLYRIGERFPDERKCKPDEFLIEQNKKFYEEKLTFIGNNGEFIALNKMRDLERTVSQKIKELIKDVYDEKDSPDWDGIMDERFGKVKDSELGEELEERARHEKKIALNTLYYNKFSVLTGRAGTGKTEVLQILIKGFIEKEKLKSDDFLILAPTGKARVRIKKTFDSSKFDFSLEPQTIHQHLNKHGWMDRNFEFISEGGNKSFAKIVIIDESSMLPIDLLATLIKSIEFSNVKRFIMVGDPNQLPPIGPGRPFDDIVKWLRSKEAHKRHTGNLKERVRHKKTDSICLRLADGFLRDFKSKDIEEIYSLIEQKKLTGKDDLFYTDWKDYDDLLSKLDDVLEEIGITDHNSYLKSVGMFGKSKDVSKCESWQILSPVKHKDISGTVSLNSYLQNKFLGDTITKWRSGKNYYYPRPFGTTKDIVHEDKVIQIRNTSKLKCYPEKPDKYVANGEIGIVKFYDKKWGQLKVEFSDQPEYLYHYYNSESEYSVELNLELAYAITIHKSQGSDFDKVILIIPEKAQNISMEMMYTALTRFKEKTYLLIQGGINTLQKYRQASSSETDGRNTFLFKIAVRDVVDSIPYAENRVHRTKNGFMVRSKSEVIVANEIIGAGVPLTEENYEMKLSSKDNPYDYKLPDFTFTSQGVTYYWEHLGMLSAEQYRKSWESKLNWYKENDYEPNLIISKDGEDGSIDSKEIDRIIEDEIGIKIQQPEEFDLDKLEESQTIEFKSSLVWDYKENKKNKQLEFVIAKTISAFMNSDGGLLVLGIDDNKNILGIEPDIQLLKKKDEDGFQLRITEIISQYLGKELAQLVKVEFKEVDDKKIALFNIKVSDDPVYVKDSDFFIRTGNSTQKLIAKEMIDYCSRRY